MIRLRWRVLCTRVEGGVLRIALAIHGWHVKIQISVRNKTYFLGMQHLEGEGQPADLS